MKKIAFASLGAGLLIAASAGASLAAQDADSLSASQRKFQTLALVARRDCAPAIAAQIYVVGGFAGRDLSSTTGLLCDPR